MVRDEVHVPAVEHASLVSLVGPHTGERGDVDAVPSSVAGEVTCGVVPGHLSDVADIVVRHEVQVPTVEDCCVVSLVVRHPRERGDIDGRPG